MEYRYEIVPQIIWFLSSFLPSPQQSPPKSHLLRLLRHVHLLQIPFIAPSVMYHLIDGSPIGQFPDIQVINIQVGFDLAARAGHIRFDLFIGMVGIDGIKLHATLAAKFHRFFQQFAFAHAP